MKKTYINKLMAIMTIPVIAFSVLSCGEPEYPTPVPATAAPTTQANILFINAVPDGPALSFFVNNTPAGSSLALGNASPYVKAPVGQAAVRANATTGKIGGILDAASVLYRAGATNQNNFSFGNGLSYTFIVTDSIARPKPTTLNGTNPGGPQFLTFTDNVSAPAAGQVKVRFYNLAPGGPSVYVTSASGTAISTFTNVAYRGTSATFNSIPAGVRNIEVRSTSTSGTVIASKASFDFVAGKIYTIFLTGKRVGNAVKVNYAVNVATHN
jgi:Domain of unknown function (DUF4397)